jgi:Fe-S-cluster containining protein
VSTIRCLSVHATYGCRHTGACCTSNWPIPVERDRFARIEAAVASGVLAASAEVRRWRATPDGELLLPLAPEGCTFYDVSGRRCTVHRALGHDALPLACRQFPRVTVREPRGVSVTLSHYCPTAASLLDDPAPVSITDAPAAFPADGEYEGLDACEMPPLLRPEMAMDWDSWWEFEWRAVDLIAHEASTTRALRRLHRIIETIRPWRPDDEPLIERVHAAFTVGPEGPVDREEREEPTAIRNYVSAHAFANWTAHLGLGLRTWLRSLEAAHDLARSVGVRQADLRLRHLSDPKRLAEAWSAAEHSTSSPAVIPPP